MTDLVPLFKCTLHTNLSTVYVVSGFRTKKLIVHSLTFRPAPSLSTLRSVRYRPHRKTRHMAASPGRTPDLIAPTILSAPESRC